VPGTGRDLAKVATLHRERLYRSADPEGMLRRTREGAALMHDGTSKTAIIAVLDLLSVDLEINRQRDSITGN
jgi:hypothetical protein